MFMCVFLNIFRAFGDKSDPPILPDAENEGRRLNEEYCEVDEEEKVVGECAEEEQSPSELVVHQASSGIEELSLAEQEEDKGTNGSEEEENQDDQKTPQGTRFSHMISMRSICYSFINVINPDSN